MEMRVARPKNRLTIGTVVLARRAGEAKFNGVHPNRRCLVNTQVDAAKAYQAFLPVAQSLAMEAVLPYRLEPDLAITNVQTGMQVLDTYKVDIPKHLPKVKLDELEGLLDLAVAVKFASILAEQTSESVVLAKLADAQKLRGILLPVAKGLAASGLFPKKEVEGIARGKGARDTAEDCVALSHLFETHASTIDGKHSVTSTEVSEAAQVGTWLLTTLRHTSAPRGKVKPISKDTDIRNRLATLLVERHEKLRVVAHYFYGSRYDEVAPPLMSRSLSKKKADTAEEATPEAA